MQTTSRYLNNAQEYFSNTMPGVKIFIRNFTGTTCLAVVFLCSHTLNADDEQIFNSGNDQVTLVELFTSQGCSSCPPAERWLGSFAEESRLWTEIVPVAFHVDYWDHIGWRDTFAQREYSERQQRYHAENGIRSVYTPGFVVNGQEWRGWFGKQPLTLTKTSAGQLRAALNDGKLKATYTAPEQSKQVLILHIALLGVGLQVDVERGENSGQKLPQDFTVLHYITLSSSTRNWMAMLPNLKLPDDVRPAIAIWVSESGQQKPLQATGGWLLH
jgi:hypothetical protein